MLGRLVSASALASALMIASAQPGAAQRASRLDSLARAVIADSNDAALRYQYALSLLQKKRWDDAERNLRVVTDLSPDHADAWVRLSTLPWSRGEGYWKKLEKQGGREAVDSLAAVMRRDWRRGFFIDPATVVHLFAQIGTLRIPAEFRIFAPWWYESYTKAMKAAADERYEESYAVLVKLLEDPRSGGDRAPNWALELHGALALRLAHYAAAEKDFAILTGRAFHAETTGVAPALAANEARYAMAVARMLDGQLGAATATFRRVLELDPSIWHAHMRLARIHEAAGRLEEAVVEQERALAVNAEDPIVPFALGTTLVRAGRVDEAEEPLRHATRVGPRHAHAWYLLGVVASDIGKQALAREAFSTFLARAPARLEREIGTARRQLAALP